MQFSYSKHHKLEAAKNLPIGLITGSILENN